VSWKPRSTVLITGGAGFIGSHLCERFHAEGWHVICLDNLFTGSIENIEPLMDSPRFEFVRHDVVFPYFAEVDLVLNFACPASPVHYQENPIKTLKTNVLGTLNMLGLASRVGARFVQASTSEVYGDPLQHPQKESYWGNVNPIGPRSCYDEGKRVAETLCFDYHRENGVDVGVIRIFNTYGPRMAVDDGRVVSNFIVQAIRNQPLTIYGEGQQTRSFCFVDDLVEGIYRFSLKRGSTGPMNLGSDIEFTVAELASEVARQINPQLASTRLPLPVDDPKVRKPDLSVARSEIDYRPKVKLADGIARSIPWFKSHV
jgi:UDP-glucuronate decarboxylase